MRIIRIKKCKDCIYCSIVPTKQRSGWCDFKKELIWRGTQFEDNFPKWCPLEKPLAELANEKGYDATETSKEDDFWLIVVFTPLPRCFKGNTYTEAEQKAREWLKKQ